MKLIKIKETPLLLLLGLYMQHFMILVRCIRDIVLQDKIYTTSVEQGNLAFDNANVVNTHPVIY